MYANYIVMMCFIETLKVTENTMINTSCIWNVWEFIMVNWLLNVTINDISVIYVTAHRYAGGLKKKLDLRSGSQRNTHFVGFFNVPVLTPTRVNHFYTMIPTHRSIKSPFTITLGIRRTHSRLKPWALTGEFIMETLVLFETKMYTWYILHL